MEGEEVHQMVLSSASPSVSVISSPHLSPPSMDKYHPSSQLPYPSVPSSSSSESSLSEICNKAIKSMVEDEIVLPLPKLDPKMGRISPVSVDSGFESSFPSSPDSTSGESRNLLLQKLETSPVQSVGVDTECKSNAGSICRASVIQMAPPGCSRLENFPDITGELPDVIPVSVAKDSGLSYRKRPFDIVCEDSMQKLNVEITSLSLSQSRSMHYVEDTFSHENNSEKDTLLIDCKGESRYEKVEQSHDIKSEELCEYQSSFAASSSSYTSSTPHSVKEDEETESYCLWDQCGQQFSTEMDLFNHVMKGHFECLHPLEESNLSKRVRGGAKGRSKSLLCKWDKCEMGLSRGDLKKQFSWLKEHFLTRHFRKAKPYCCLIDGCSARFSFKRALEDHLRTGHDKVKRTEVGRKKKPKVESCLEWTPLPYYPPDPKNDFLDKATIEYMVMRLRKYENTEKPQFIPRPPPGPRGGAAYRKRKRILTWDIVPFEEFYKQELERKRLEIANNVPQVGEYAAEQWKRIFSKVL